MTTHGYEELIHSMNGRRDLDDRIRDYEMDVIQWRDRRAKNGQPPDRIKRKVTRYGDITQVSWYAVYA